MHKLIVSSLALVLVTLGWGNQSLGDQVPAPQGELWIVDKHPANWAYITFNVFEHLMEIDKDGALVPRLATSWQWLNDRTLEGHCQVVGDDVVTRQQQAFSGCNFHRPDA